MTFHFSSFYLNYEALNLDPMKNYIFILLLVFSCNLSAQYFPTVEDNPIWKTDFSSVSGSGQSEITLHQTIDTCGNLWTAYEEAFDFPDFNFNIVSNSSFGYA